MILTPVRVPRDDVSCAIDADCVLGFKSKKIRVNLNMPIKAQETKEQTEVLKTVDEDRKYVIQATIVRYVIPSIPSSAFIVFIMFCSIMKARKTMKNQALIQEVISQISQRFTPKIPDIKKVGLRSVLLALCTPAHLLSTRRSTTFSRRSTSNVWRAPATRSHTLHKLAPSSSSFP